MLDTLLQWDYELFRLINGVWHYDWLDSVMPVLRDKRTWIPLYITLLLLFFDRFHWKKAALVVVLSILTIGISDTLSSRIVKKNIERPRPCHDETSNPYSTRLLVGCGGYSFTSSHATNHFALAGFWLLVFGGYAQITGVLFLLWAASIAYAQVYVGVHYPADVLAGGLMGVAIGHLVYFLLRLMENKLIPPPKVGPCLDSSC